MPHVGCRREGPRRHTGIHRVALARLHAIDAHERQTIQIDNERRVRERVGEERHRCAVRPRFLVEQLGQQRGRGSRAAVEISGPQCKEPRPQVCNSTLPLVGSLDLILLSVT